MRVFVAPDSPDEGCPHRAGSRSGVGTGIEQKQNLLTGQTKQPFSHESLRSGLASRVSSKVRLITKTSFNSEPSNVNCPMQICSGGTAAWSAQPTSTCTTLRPDSVYSRSAKAFGTSTNPSSAAAGITRLLPWWKSSKEHSPTSEHLTVARALFPYSTEMELRGFSSVGEARESPGRAANAQKINRHMVRLPFDCEPADTPGNLQRSSRLPNHQVQIFSITRVHRERCNPVEASRIICGNCAVTFQPFL